MAGALVAGLLVAGPAATAGAAEVVDDAPLIWLEGELTDNGGTMPSSFDPSSADYGLTLDAVLALTLGGRGTEAPATDAMALFEADVNSYITGEGFGDTGSAYAGAIGKSLVTVAVRDGDVNDFGGVDLEALSRSAIQTDGLQQGRFSDVSTFGDFSNGFGQALNISGLSYTPDGAPSDAVDFLIDQQCPAGGFRLTYTTDPATRGCESDDEASTDVTALAIQALLAVDPSVETRDAIDAAVVYLLDLQADDGGFDANANSTGLASQALFAAAETDAATSGLLYVIGLQLSARAQPDEAGAIAFDPAAFDAAFAAGIEPAQRDQFRRATSQGVLAYGLASFGDIDDYVAVTPERILDTRTQTPVVADEVNSIQVTGDGAVPNTAGAVALNVTAVRGTGTGFVTVWDCSTPGPDTSSVNFSGPDASPNSVITGLSDDGSVCFYSNQDVDVIIDVNGYFPAGSSYTSITPDRLVDTRRDEAIPADGRIEVEVGGQVDPPITVESSAVLNVTAVRGAGNGFLTVWDCSTPRPTTSSVNFSGPAASPNTVISKLSDTGTVCVYADQSVDVLVDISGAFPEDADFTGVTPDRVLDTRSDVATPAGDVTVSIAGDGDVPESATAVALNVTAVRGAATGFVTVWDCSTPRPETSSVNFSGPAATPNNVIAKLSDSGDICLYTSESVDLIVDVGGYFG
ncbi:MAG: prenyltransferase/squalene oxidase repeat-containing protein [Ilumatobacter sp.]|uniref:prenyltransferase/squalene oxidase repeat-containing protein n=1 Tax=Ilumatobacter sp. TaxID=1967498 RepID=UPI003C708628